MRITKNWLKGKQEALDETNYQTDLEVAVAIGSFLGDPPDSNYQRGYLAGLRELFMKMQKSE